MSLTLRPTALATVPAYPHRADWTVFEDGKPIARRLRSPSPRWTFRRMGNLDGVGYRQRGTRALWSHDFSGPRPMYARDRRGGQRRTPCAVFADSSSRRRQLPA